MAVGMLNPDESKLIFDLAMKRCAAGGVERAIHQAGYGVVEWPDSGDPSVEPAAGRDFSE
ncbi:MAG TPA: hypothetical protein VFQ44_03635 [Streptosporangiaceae bacterium]|nr:hypothetical protein [Streptosporangiaceae bacterium]